MKGKKKNTTIPQPTKHVEYDYMLALNLSSLQEINLLFIRCSTDARAPNNGVELTLQSLSSNEGDILHLTPMETQHPNNVVDLMLFQLYCHLASNPNGNATSKRLSTRPNDLTQVLVWQTKNKEPLRSGLNILKRHMPNNYGRHDDEAC